MALASYVRAIRSHALLASALFLLVFGAGIAWSVARSATYQATARILVSPLPQDDTTFLGLPLIRDSGDPTQNMETVATLIDSPQTAQLTASALGRGWSARRVESAVNVQPEGQSEILDVSASASSPKLAARIANTFTTSALALRAARLRQLVAQEIASISAQLATISNKGSVAAGDLETQLSQLRPLSSGQDPTVTLSQTATVPRSTSGLSKPLIALLGLLAGLVLASGVPLLLELVGERRVFGEENLRAVVPGPVLARIPMLPRLRRRGNPARGAPVPPAISEALRGLRIQLDLLGGRHRTILITSASKGDGKTTTAINLAREISGSGGRVIVVDLDLRHPEIAPRFGVAPDVDLATALESPEPMRWVRDAARAESLGILPAVEDHDFETLDRVARALGGFLEGALGQVDYVILDAPPLGEVADVLRFIGSVDDVLLVSRLGHTKLGSLEVAKEFLERADRRPTGHVVIGSSRRHAPKYGYYQPVTVARSRSTEPTETGQARL